MNDSPPRHRLIFITLVAVTFISPLANHMFIPATPLVKEEFGIGDELAFATLSLTMMTMAITSLIYGGVSDQWGRKRVLLFGLALYTVPELVAGSSSHERSPAMYLA